MAAAHAATSTVNAHKGLRNGGLIVAPLLNGGLNVALVGEGEGEG